MQHTSIHIHIYQSTMDTPSRLARLEQLELSSSALLNTMKERASSTGRGGGRSSSNDDINSEAKTSVMAALSRGLGASSFIGGRDRYVHITTDSKVFLLCIFIAIDDGGYTFCFDRSPTKKNCIS